MSLFKKLALVAAISPIFLLSGCSDSIVESAQELKVNVGKEMTVQELFKGSAMTKSVKWSEEKNPNLGEVALAVIDVKIPTNIYKQVEDIQEALKVERRAKLAQSIDYERKRAIKEAEEQIAKLERFEAPNDPEWHANKQNRYQEIRTEAQAYISLNNQYQLKKVEENDLPFGPWLNLKSVNYKFAFAKNKKDQVVLVAGGPVYAWEDGHKYSEFVSGRVLDALLWEVAGKKQFLVVDERLPEKLKDAYRRAVK